MRKALKDLAYAVALAIRQIDAEMNLPSTPDRGRKIASITNQLELQNDKSLHFDLGYSFKKITAIKRGEK